MIRLTEVYRDIVRLNGAPAEMMLFYTLWQSSLWPGWMQHDDHLGEENDTPTKQRKTAIEAYNRPAFRPCRLGSERRNRKKHFHFA
jgi:hypothetical protein